MNLALRLFLGSLLVLWLRPISAEEFDLAIRNGRVVDGSGSPAFVADIGVKDGRIVTIGLVTGEVDREVDASGLIVAPGFIDVHTHAEEVDELPLAENFVRMGVTTLVMGNCGYSVSDVGKFFKRLEKKKISANVGTMIGHGLIRSQAMGGSFDRPPSRRELRRMRSRVKRAMKDGALGLSTGLIYLPGVFAETEEIIDLLQVVRRYDGIYATHMRSESDQIFEALEEAFRISREAGVRVEISHIKLAGKSNWGRASKVLQVIDQARSEGLDITQDQYVYTASSTGISQLVPERYREGGRFKENIKDPATKAELVADMKRILKKRGRENYGYAVIARYKKDPSLDGLNIVEAAAKTRGSSSVENQIDLILEIHGNGGASGVFHGISERDLREFQRHPNTMFASDSAVRKFQEGAPHPRGYGNSARVLARYVRELKLLDVEDAIRRMTSLPAKTFRLQDRGLLQEGAWADLVLFDLNQVQDRAKFGDPHHYATGFRQVIVNGQVVIQEDQHTGERPGMILRHKVKVR